MLNVLSILSIDSLFYTSKEDKEAKNNSLLSTMKKYVPVIGGTHYHSDHLTKANILHQYEKSGNKKQFCKQNLINKNNIKRAVLVREQLKEYIEQILRERKKRSFDEERTVNLSFSLTSEKIKSWIECMKKNGTSTIGKLNKHGSYTLNKSGEEGYIHP